MRTEIQPPNEANILILDEDLQSMFAAAQHIAGIEVYLGRCAVADSAADNPKLKSTYDARFEALRTARAALDQLASVWLDELASFQVQSGMGYVDDFGLSIGDKHFTDKEFQLDQSNWSTLSRLNWQQYYSGARLKFGVGKRPKFYPVLFTQRRKEWQARIPDFGERVVGHGSSIWQAWQECETAWRTECSDLETAPTARIKRLLDVPRKYMIDARYARLMQLLVGRNSGY